MNITTYLLFCAALLFACKNEAPKSDKSLTTTPLPTDTAIVSQPDTSSAKLDTIIKQETRQDKENTCDDILKALWSASDHSIGKQMPPIRLVKTDTHAASFWYDTSRVTGKEILSIDIEEKAYDLCKKLGPEAFRPALAFIVAHELAHYFQYVYKGQKLPKETGFHAKKSSFLNYNAIPGGYKDEEGNADLSGAFNVYLAQMPLDSNILFRLIDTLYAYYPKAKDSNKYPPKDVRQKTMQKIAQQFQELCVLYEAAPFFSAIGSHDLAIEAYETVLLYYRGKEVYVGKGVAHARKALAELSTTRNETALRIKNYIYPLETDWETRLRRPGSGIHYAADAFDKEIDSALLCLGQALQIDPHDELAELNLLTVKALSQNKTKEPIRFSEVRADYEHYIAAYGRQSTYGTQAKMTYALAHVLSDGKSDSLRTLAESIFRELIQTCKDSTLLTVAQHNLSVLQKKISTKPVTASLKKTPKEISDHSPELDAKHTTSSLALCPDVRAFWQENRQKNLLVFEHQKKRVALLRIRPYQSDRRTANDANAVRLGSGGAITVWPKLNGGCRSLNDKVVEYFGYKVTDR